ncbi:methyl-accepting chemotaxis protein 2 [mine drainage metagenome]|uniref:Methyl-accepting chemotaxis protein 2 n=1 Tax=mine drainage metagenome TaxID=410659 RepID=A0A1J5RYY5_9ZZZZ
MTHASFQSRIGRLASLTLLVAGGAVLLSALLALRLLGDGDQGLGLAALALSALLALALILGALRVLPRLKRLSDLIHRGSAVAMAASHGDLNVRVTRIGRDDELGDLMVGLNRVLDLTEEFAKDVGAAMTRAGAKEYFRYIPERGLRGDFLTFSRLINKVLADMEARNQETALFEHSVYDLVSKVSDSTQGITQTAGMMAHRSENAGGQTISVGRAAEETTQRAAAVSEATRQLAIAVNEIAQQVSLSTSIAREAVTSITGTSQRISGLTDAVQEIGTVVEMITAIAGQTNLLALNATIEAARAGEAGKGFAVVAGEVKNLANQTARATDDISRQVAAVRDAATEAVTGINGVVETIRRMDEIAATIASAVQEQEASTREISSHIDQVASQSKDVSMSVANVAQASAQACGGTVRVLWSAKSLGNVVEALNQRVADYVRKVN